MESTQNWLEVFELSCKAKQSWGLYASWSGDLPEVLKAAPWLKDFQPLFEDWIMVFGTEAEITRLFKLTVGDDGPTKENPYKGPVKVFATTCGPDGRGRHENT